MKSMQERAGREPDMNQVYIFKTDNFVSPEDLERIRNKLKRQIEEGVVLLDGSTDLIRSERPFKECPIAVEILPTRE